MNFSKPEIFRKINHFENDKNINEIYNLICLIFNNNLYNNDIKFLIDISNRCIINCYNINDLVIIEDTILNKLDYNLDESVITMMIKKYSDLFGIDNSDYCNFKSRIDNYFELILKKNYKLKQRTISPIINFYYKNSKIESIYKYIDVAFKNQIKLQLCDYAKIINLCLTFNNYEYLTFIVSSLMLDYVYINNEFINIISYIRQISVNSDGKIFDKNNGIILENYILKKEDMSNEIRNDISNILLNIISEDNKINISKLNKWLDSKKPNIILDGANIGYSNKQNKNNKINFKKIEIVRNYYSKLGKSVVIFLHKRHFHKKLNNCENEIINKWNKFNCIYKTPYKLNDDLFWIYSTIRINNCFFVTNDKIRDHYYEIIHKNNIKSKKISPFIYWYNDYNISYNFKNDIFEPNPISNYSIKIQLNKYDNTNYCCLPTIDKKWFMILYDCT